MRGKSEPCQARIAAFFSCNCPGSSAKSGLWPRQRPESQFFQRKFAYRPPLRGGTWAPSRGTWAVTFHQTNGRRRLDELETPMTNNGPGTTARRGYIPYALILQQAAVWL